MYARNLLCDLDGTLVDSLPGIEYACREAVRQVLSGYSLGGLRHRIGPPIRQILREELPRVDEETLDRILATFRESYDSDGWQLATPYPGAVDTLERLLSQGLRCFVVTNKPRVPTVRILDHLGMARLFEDVISPDSNTPPFTSKAAAVAWLCSAHRLEPAESVMIGDTKDDGMAAASAGIPFIWAEYGYGRFGHDGAVAIACITEFSQLVEHMGCAGHGREFPRIRSDVRGLGG